MSELNFAKRLMGLGDNVGAAQELIKVLKKNSKNIEAWFLLAAVINDKDKEAECYRRILRIDPSNQRAEESLLQLVKLKKSTQERTDVSPDTKPRKRIIETIYPLWPRILTTVSGVGVVLGAGFTWKETWHITTDRSRLIESVSGINLSPGIFITILGILIILISYFGKTKKGNFASPISSLFAFGGWILGTLWKLSLPLNIGDIFLFSADGTPYDRVSTGFGYSLSMFSLFLSLISGLVKNKRKWMGNFLMLFVIFGGIAICVLIYF